MCWLNSKVGAPEYIPSTSLALDPGRLMGCPGGILYNYYGYSAVSGYRGYSHLLPGWDRLSIHVGGASCSSRQIEKSPVLSRVGNRFFGSGFGNGF